jgi:hypothetical protein
LKRFEILWWQRGSDYYHWLNQELAAAGAGACADEMFLLFWPFIALS